MKSRSEVLREKREREKSGARPSAEERTVPLPALPPGTRVHCDACGEDADADACTVRPDGFAECPACGAPVALKKPAAAERPKAPEGRPEPELPRAPKTEEFVPKHPERKWCGECGTAVSFTSRGFFFPCGHDKADRIEDPRKAKSIKPPAGLQTMTEKEVERRDAEDAAAAAHAPSTAAEAKASPKASSSRGGPSGPPTGPGTPTVSGNRLSIPWGEARFPLPSSGDQFNSFKVGGHIITVELPEGVDRGKAAEEIIADLERIADRLFERQKAWYEKRLASLYGGGK